MHRTQFETWCVGHLLPRPELLQCGESTGWYPENNLIISLLDRPTQREVNAHSSGRIRLALLERSPLLVLYISFGPGALFESPWVWLEGNQPPPWATDPAAGHLLFSNALVDVRSGIVRSLRTATADRRFSGQLSTAMRKVLAAGPVPEGRVMELVNEHRVRHPDVRTGLLRAQYHGHLGNA